MYWNVRFQYVSYNVSGTGTEGDGQKFCYNLNEERSLEHDADMRTHGDMRTAMWKIKNQRVQYAFHSG